MARIWNWQTWGRAADLIHQSDLNGLVGKFGCPEQFRRKKEERITGERVYESAGGKLCSGNAVHAVAHRVLRSAAAAAVVLKHPHVPGDPRIGDHSIACSFDEEFERERAGREVTWYKVNPEKWRADCLAMLRGLFDDIHNHVGETVMAECAFVYQLDGMWMTGAIDYVYRARLPDGSVSERLSFSDWKTGAQRPHQIDLDHGWQSGIYGNAMRSAYFVPFENVPRPAHPKRHRDAVEEACTEIAVAWQAAMDCDDRQASLAETGDSPAARLDAIVKKWGAVKFSEYPERIRYVHLRDYIPYTRKGTKTAERPEELAFYNLAEKAKVPYAKGETRGPAWYHVNRAESDTPRLRHLLRAVVSWVRFGRFPAAPGEMCSRCKFREPCLLDGYKPIGEERKQLAAVQKALGGFDGLEDVGEL